MNLNTHSGMQIARSILSGCSVAAGQNETYTQRLILEAAVSRAFAANGGSGEAAGAALSTYLKSVVSLLSQGADSHERHLRCRFSILLDRAILDAMEDSPHKVAKDDLHLTMLTTCKKSF